MYANNLKQLAYRLGWLGSLATILIMALLYLASSIVKILLCSHHGRK